MYDEAHHLINAPSSRFVPSLSLAAVKRNFLLGSIRNFSFGATVAAPTRRRIAAGLISSIQMAFDKPLVFISCGQYNDTEKRLGKDICSLLASLRPDVNPYFAEDQSTVEGLSNQVLKALHRAAGFICVMHRRGDLMVPEGGKITRGSVWIEQEIAIAAFMNHVLDRSIPILFYKQAGVNLEGIRWNSRRKHRSWRI
jgi:hypothetical protein